MKIKLYFLKINIIPENTTVTLYMPEKSWHAAKTYHWHLLVS